MHRKVLESISGVEIYPIFVLILFFVFFVTVLFWIIRLNKIYLEHMSRLPLGDKISNSKQEKNNE